MEYEFFLVNAFTDSPYKGNGAGVCLIGSPKVSDALKQNLAKEINLSETAFVTSKTGNNDFQKESEFGLRWFTPLAEVPLCGHATLASAAVLFYHIGNRNPKITFDTASGPLIVEKKNDMIRMELPWRETVAPTVNDDDVKRLVKAAVGDLPVKDVRLCPVARYPLIRLDDRITRKDFESFAPDITELMKSGSYIGVIVTVKGDSSKGFVDKQGTGYDFASRFFAPWVGIDEDPVTGSAHNILGPYWANILGKKQLYACQSSKRLGELWLEVKQPGNPVTISGKSFTYLKGRVRVQ